MTRIKSRQVPLHATKYTMSCPDYSAEGDTWSTDELYVKIQESMNYLFGMMDNDARFRIAQQVEDYKGTSDVSTHSRRKIHPTIEALTQTNLPNLPEGGIGKKPERLVLIADSILVILALNENLRVSVTKKIPVPISYAFEWLTDFREDDPQLTGSDINRKILEKTPNKTTYLSEQMKEGRLVKTKYVVDTVPPDRWHYTASGDDRDSVGEYRLVAEGVETRLDMTYESTYKRGPIPTMEESERDSHEFWDKLIPVLLKDYRDGKPAR